MWRNKDPRKDEVDSVAQRLRSERPEPSPLELDRIKTTAMSRARAAGGRSGARRRLAVAGLTVGLMAAGTGGVIASGGTSSNPGDAATAQYGGYQSEGGVKGSKHHKVPMSHRRITIHLIVPHRATLTLVTVKVNGKTLFVLKGSRASSSINLPNLPCGNGATTIVVTAVTRGGATITETRQFHLCQATDSRHSGHPAKS